MVAGLMAMTDVEIELWRRIGQERELTFMWDLDQEQFENRLLT